LGSTTSAAAGSALGVGRTVGDGRGVAGAVGRADDVTAGVAVVGELTATGVGATDDGAQPMSSTSASSHGAWRATTLDDGMAPWSHPTARSRNEQMGYRDRSDD
jgi:hypothetical protein